MHNAVSWAEDVASCFGMASSGVSSASGPSRRVSIDQMEILLNVKQVPCMEPHFKGLKVRVWLEFMDNRTMLCTMCTAQWLANKYKDTILVLVPLWPSMEWAVGTYE